LQEEITHTHKKATETVKKDKEIAELQNVIDSFGGYFGLIDKHMKTLVKMLRDLISKCDDPKAIEHNQKQIKSIESLLDELKLTLSSHSSMGDAANRLLESFFQISNESLREVHINTSGVVNPNNETSVSIPEADTAKKQGILGKRRKLNEDGEFIQVKVTGDEENNAPAATSAKVEIGVGYESTEETGKKSATIAVGNMSMSKNKKKLNEKL
jgi:hypothetical protein